MYNYMYDELQKLWEIAPMQQSELMSQIERLRAYIQRHLQQAELEINHASQTSSNQKNKKRTKKQQEKEVEKTKEPEIIPVSVITPTAIPVVMPISMLSFGASSDAMKLSHKMMEIPKPMPIIPIVNPIVVVPPIMSKE